MHSSIEVIGHRGARGLYPELSLAGFKTALDLDVDGLEIDIGITADQCVIAYHDYRLNPDITRDKYGRWLKTPRVAIRDVTLNDLREYDIGRINPASAYSQQFPNQLPVDGSHIPTLEEIVDLVRGHKNEAALYLEVKRNPTSQNQPMSANECAERIISELRRLNISDGSVIHSFDWHLLNQVRAIDSDQKIWHLTSQLDSFNTVAGGGSENWTGGFQIGDYGNSIPRMIKAAGGSVWNSDYQSLDAQSIAQAHDLNLKVYAWTVNDAENFESLYESGIDGIITDYPDRLVQYLAER